MDFKVTRKAKVGFCPEYKFILDNQEYSMNGRVSLSRALTQTTNEFESGLWNEGTVTFYRENAEVCVSFAFSLPRPNQVASMLRKDLLERAELVNKAFAYKYPAIDEVADNTSDNKTFEDLIKCFNSTLGFKAKLLKKNVTKNQYFLPGGPSDKADFQMTLHSSYEWNNKNESAPDDYYPFEVGKIGNNKFIIITPWVCCIIEIDEENGLNFVLKNNNCTMTSAKAYTESIEECAWIAIRGLQMINFCSII